MNKNHPSSSLASALRLLSLALIFAAFLGSPQARATSYYWDTNGTTAGSGAATGTWGSDTFWSTDTTGVAAPFVVTTGTADALRFSAGSNGTAGTVTVSGTQNAATINLTQTGLTFTGGTIALAGITGNVLTLTSSATINSALAFNFTTAQAAAIAFTASGQTLTLGGGLTNTSTASTGVTVVGSTALIAAASSLQLNSGTYQMTTFNIGDQAAGTGGVSLNSGASLTVGTTISVGSGSGTSTNGLFTVNGGSLSNSASASTAIVVGRGTGLGRMIVSSGNVTVGGATGTLIIGFQNTTAPTGGELDMNGGTIAVAGSLAVGSAGSSGNATLNITGGTTTVGTLDFGKGGSFAASTGGNGLFTLTGGTLYVGMGGIVQDGTGTYASTRTISGGIIGAKGTWSSSLAMTLATTNGSVTFQAADASANVFNITLSGALSGAGGFIKTGGGTLFLTGANTFTGDVHLNAGTLSASSAFVDNSASLYLLTGSTLNLNYNGSDSISKLFIDGQQQDAGLYDASNLSAFITGTGSLTVLGSAIPEPATDALLLGALGLGLAVLHRRRQSTR